MKVPKKSLFIAGAALLCTSVASAQVNDGKTTFRRYTKPLRTVSLDLETGDITRGPVVQNRAVSTCSTLSNIDLGGFVGVDTGACACEWIDAASTTGKSSFVTNFVFAYCSAALDTASGGVGGSAELFFREGYQKGGASQGTEIGRFLLTGLPANTNCSSFFGGFTCFFINITFGNIPLCMNDGNIGYGWKFVDLGTDGVLAKTFPFLSCVQSCTGVGPDQQGMTDCVDQYCPPGSLLSTFSFGTTPFGGYFTSISMDLREAIPADTPSTTMTGSGANPVILVDHIGGNPNTMGLSPSLADPTQAYEHSLFCPAPCATSKVEIRGGGAIVVSVGGGCAEILCAKPKFIKFGGGPTNQISIPLPKDLSFACVVYCAQGTCFNCANGCTNVGSGLVLSNSFIEIVDV